MQYHQFMHHGDHHASDESKLKDDSPDVPPDIPTTSTTLSPGTPKQTLREQCNPDEEDVRSQMIRSNFVQVKFRTVISLLY